MFLFAWTLVVTGTLGSTSTFETANALYRDKNYAKAALLYDSLAAEKGAGSVLFFNAGNAHFKHGDIARAILNYERARRLAPADEDILFNLKIAYANTVDKIEPIPLLFYERWWQGFLTLLSPGVWSVLAVVWIWLAAAAGLLYLFAGTVARKRNAFLLALTLLCVSLFTYRIAASAEQLIHGDTEAVVMEPSTYVRSSPDAASTNLFMLHEGTKVDITERINGWCRIRIANGNVGWVEDNHIEAI
jgi:uncharacterized protein YgiM (DUF1202 family)